MDITALELAEKYAKVADDSWNFSNGTYYMARAIYFLLVYYLPKMVKGE